MASSHRTQVREDLLDAAEELFASAGYASVTHADIAFAARIGRTTFYEYFASKEDLLVQLVETKWPRLARDLVNGIPGDVATVDRLCELTLRMIEFVATDPLGSLLHTEVLRLGPRSQALIAQAHASTELSDEFVRLYRRGVREGLFRAMPVDIAARLMYEVIMAAGRVLKSSPDPKQRVHEVGDAVTAFLMAGLRGG